MTMPPDLSPAARALLDAARDGMTPDAAAIQRVRAKVAASAGGAAASALFLKLGLAGVLALVAVGAVVQRARSAETAEAPRIAITTSSGETRAVTHEVAPPIAPPIAPPVAPPLADSVDERAPIEMAAESMRRTPPPHEEADLAREVALIDRAMAALAKGDTTTALHTIALHTAETHGRGQLAEDAAAIEIEALCRLHAPTVAAKLEDFDARFPRSAQRSRLTSRCKE